MPRFSQVIVFSAFMGIIVPFGFADEPASASGEAVYSFSGKKGKPVTIVDHRKDVVTVHDEIRLVNQSTEGAIAAGAARREAARETVAAMEADRVSAQAAAAADADDGGELADSQQGRSLEDGVAQLRAQNWVSFGGGNGVPAQMYNPETKQFVPTAQAVKSLAPPAARGSDPTP